MTDYRQLSEAEQKKVIQDIKTEVEEKHHINPSNGFEWDEPEYTIRQVIAGRYCAECWRIYYNCLCSHDD